MGEHEPSYGSFLVITQTCKQCGGPTSAYPSKAKRKKYCSRKCYAEWLSENQRGENHHMYGKKHSAESIAKMSRAQKARGLHGPRAHNWNGGTHLASGYRMIALSILPPEEQELFGSMATRSSNSFIPEHRIVMARHLGRALVRSEVVHHRNGVKDDNRLENLELMNKCTHKMTHRQVLRELQALRRENETLKAQVLSLS